MNELIAPPEIRPHLEDPSLVGERERVYTEACPSCEGVGAVSATFPDKTTAERPCATCRGNGMVLTPQGRWMLEMVLSPELARTARRMVALGCKEEMDAIIQRVADVPPTRYDSAAFDDYPFMRWARDAQYEREKESR